MGAQVVPFFKFKRYLILRCLVSTSRFMAGTEINRELLSRHSVHAVFKGCAERQSRVMMHPPPPPRLVADFNIIAYIEYDKPGQYGDEQQKRFQCDVAEQS